VFLLRLQPIILLTTSIVVWFPVATGVLRFAVSVGSLFCPGLLLRYTHASCKTTEICDILHVRLLDIYGIFWYTARPCGAPNFHDPTGSAPLYLLLLGIDVYNALFYVLYPWHNELCLCHDIIGSTTGCAPVVFDQLSTGRHRRSILCVCGNGTYTETSFDNVCPFPSCLYGTLFGMAC
jgi:hypothetical protein